MVTTLLGAVSCALQLNEALTFRQRRIIQVGRYNLVGARSSNILTPAVSVSDVRVCVCACCLRVACCIYLIIVGRCSSTKYVYSPDGANLQLYEGSKKPLSQSFARQTALQSSPVVDD